MIVNTRRLFIRLLPRLQITAVCDVGSMNGADALAFRDALPQSSVFAFEPNSENFRLMQADRALQASNIHLAPLAVSDHDGEAEFFLVDADYSRTNPLRGMSSLYRRSHEYSPAAVIPVKTTRLDTFLADRCPPDVRLALWIDAEGKAYEVIAGTCGISAQVQLMHVEVETAPCISSGQKLYSEVRTLSHQLGFVAIATDQPLEGPQLNVLFVRRELLAKERFRMGVWLARAWLRQRLVRVARTICPACLRRYQAIRSAGRH